MSVGFVVKYYWYQVGSSDFLYSFFSTVAYNLEEKKWGSKYPYIMLELYAGCLKKNHIKFAISELDALTKRLKDFDCSHVVWNFENLSLLPPWGNNISPDISDLSNYFVTSDGEDFLTIFRHALEKGLETDCDVLIKSL